MVGENGFDSSRAELFEALGHPTRVKILRSLQSGALGFTELKKEVGIESSGHLQFHMGRLGNLVGTSPDGSYILTDEGREALRVLSMARVGNSESAQRIRSTLGQVAWQRVILSGLLIAMVIMAGLVVYQQEEIASLNGAVSSDTVMIGGMRYYYESVPAVWFNGTGLTFHQVSFTFLEVPNYCYSTNLTFECSVRLSNGTVLDLAGKTVGMSINGMLARVESNQTAPGGSSGFTGTALDDSVVVSYPDGAHEAFNGFNLTANYQSGYNGFTTPIVVLTYSFNPPVANPWFGVHGNPKVGINWDSSRNGFVLYVSVTG